MNNRQARRFPICQLHFVVVSLLVAGVVLAVADAQAFRGGGGFRGGAGFGGGGFRGGMAGNSIAGMNRGGGDFGSRSIGGGDMGNRGNFDRTNVNTGNINRGNVNVNNNVNVNVDHDYNNGWGGGWYHPVAAGVAIGAMAVTTAAVLGSYYYALPATGCAQVVVTAISYYQCGSVYYRQTWSGSTVVYEVVNP